MGSGSHVCPRSSRHGMVAVVDWILGQRERGNEMGGAVKARPRWWLAVVAVLVLVAGACGGDDGDTGGGAAGGDTSTDEGEPTSGGTLRMNIVFDGRSLDPIGFNSLGTSSNDGYRAYALDDSLLQEDPATGEVKPRLFETFETDDSTVWTFTIKEGVEFSDGTPFDAEAGEVQLGASRRPRVAGTGLAAMNQVASMEVVDPLTLQVTLKRPNGQFPRAVRAAAVAGRIADRHPGRSRGVRRAPGRRGAVRARRVGPRQRDQVHPQRELLGRSPALRRRTRATHQRRPDAALPELRSRRGRDGLPVEPRGRRHRRAGGLRGRAVRPQRRSLRDLQHHRAAVRRRGRGEPSRWRGTATRTPRRSTKAWGSISTRSSSRIHRSTRMPTT